MSRTRGASKGFSGGDRVALDRQGNPISPYADDRRRGLPMSIDGDFVARGPAPITPPVQKLVAYRADRASWSRNMGAYELACLIDMALREPSSLGDGLVVVVTPEKFATLSGDMRLHFKPVYEVAE